MQFYCPLCGNALDVEVPSDEEVIFRCFDEQRHKKSNAYSLYITFIEHLSELSAVKQWGWERVHYGA